MIKCSSWITKKYLKIKSEQTQNSEWLSVTFITLIRFQVKLNFWALLSNLSDWDSYIKHSSKLVFSNNLHPPKFISKPTLTRSLLKIWRKSHLMKICYQSQHNKASWLKSSLLSNKNQTLLNLLYKQYLQKISFMEHFINSPSQLKMESSTL